MHSQIYDIYCYSYKKNILLTTLLVNPIDCTHKIVGNRHFLATLVTNMCYMYISTTIPVIFANKVLKCARDVKEKVMKFHVYLNEPPLQEKFI